MNIIWDIAGSLLIGAIVTLLIINLDVYSQQTKYGSDENVILQDNAITLAEILGYDMRKVGYKADSTKIITADSTRFSFYADIDSNGTVDKVTYFLGDSTTAPSTPNPHDRVLYRVVNNDTIGGPSLGLSRLLFVYMDANGSITSDTKQIKYIKTKMWVETTEMVEGKYPYTYWEITISPRNL